LIKWIVGIIIGLYIIATPGPWDIGELIIDSIGDSQLCDGNEKCIERFEQVKNSYNVIAVVFTVLSSIQIYRIRQS